MSSQNSANTICLVLLFIWVILILLLVYLYRRLNRDTNGQYTVRKIVLGEGGLRDQVRSGVGAMQTRLGVHLWPRSRPSDEEDVVEDEEEAKEGDVESGQSQGADHSKGAEEDNGEPADEDSDDDYSSMGGMDLRERAKLMEDVKEDTQEAKSIETERKEEEPGKGREEEVKEEGKKAEGLSLLVNLQELSGSAIWSEENKDKNEEIDLTAL